MPATNISEHEALFDCTVKKNLKKVNLTGMNDFSIPSLKMPNHQMHSEKVQSNLSIFSIIDIVTFFVIYQLILSSLLVSIYRSI